MNVQKLKWLYVLRIDVKVHMIASCQELRSTDKHKSVIDETYS